MMLQHFPILLRVSADRSRPFVMAAALACVSACAGTDSKPPEKPPVPVVIPAPVPVAAVDETLGSSTDPKRTPTFLLGDGNFVRKAPEKAEGTGAPAAPGGIELTLVDVDLRTALSSILGDTLGLSYTVDPSIKGTLTIRSARGLQRSEVIPALEAALRLQDIAMVPQGDGFAIVPIKDAQRSAQSLRFADSERSGGFGVEIVPLHYVNAEEMEKILAPFAPAGGVVRADGVRNLLLLAGSSQEQASMLEVVRMFDVDWMAGMSYAMFPVEYADPKTIADELKDVLFDGKSPLNGTVRLIPLSRINMLLVASPNAEYLSRVGDWIKRLDLGNSSPGRRIYVYDVQNGRSGDLADTLGQIFGISSGARSKSSQSQIGASRTNSSTSALGSSQYGSSSALNSGGQTGSSFAPTSTRAPLGQAALSDFLPASGSSTGDTSGLRIVPSEENNSLLVLATPSEFTIIESAIKRLDVTPRQVLIEASLAEVTLTDELQYGVQWAFVKGHSSTTFSPSSDGSIASSFPGFSYAYTGVSSITAVLNALESITKVKVISSPKLMVLNNHEAQIQVGDEVPILTQQAVSTGQTNAPIVNSVDQRDTGVILHVTPRVNKSGVVILDIDQEVSAVTPTTTSNINSPTIQERRISTTIAARDGETIALGGLITENTSRSRSGIPFLSRIPYLGWLFGQTDDSKSRTELIVLLKPRVVRDDREMQGVMEDLRDQFKNIIPSDPKVPLNP